MKLSEVACNILSEEGVEHVFGLMGDGNMALIAYLTSELGIPFHTSRHEAAGVGMADGYARATGKVGVCTVTQGPGLTNAATALVTARKGRTPLVLLLGDVGQAQQGWPQDIDHGGFLGALNVSVIQATDPTTIHDDVRRAFALARATSAPVAVNFPLDRQNLEWQPWDVDVERTEAVNAVKTTDSASDAEVSVVAGRLMEARRPLIIAGRGALHSGAGEALQSLGQQTGALLATTLPAKGLFRDDPFNIGIAGSLGSNVAASLIGQADVVLTVGASLNDFTTVKGSLFGDGCTVVRCDVEIEPAANRREADLNLQGDALAIADRLLTAAAVAGPLREGYRTPSVGDQLRTFDISGEFADQSEPGAMDPRSLMLALGRILPQRRQVVTDVGHFFGFPSTFLPPDEGGRFFPVVDFGAVGAGIGVAIGASIGRPDLTTVFFVGDGGLMMSLPDLDTAARLKVRMIIVVMNDGAYGSELHMLRQWKLPTEGTEFDNPSFEALAEAFGLHAMTLHNVAEVAAISHRLDADQFPLLIDCCITQGVLASWLADAFDR